MQTAHDAEDGIYTYLTIALCDPSDVKQRFYVNAHPYEGNNNFHVIQSVEFDSRPLGSNHGPRILPQAQLQEHTQD